MRHKYTPEQHTFLQSFIPGHRFPETVEAYNKRFPDDPITEPQARAYAKNHHTPTGLPGGIDAGSPSEVFPQEVRDYILAHCAGCSRKEMTSRLNERFGAHYKPSQIAAYYKNHHIRNGLDGRFRKGCTPPNKGRKGMRMHPNAVRTQFRKGHTPANKMPIGTVARKTDGYWWRKIGEGARDWKQAHRIRWEEVNGPVPEGHHVMFLDGNKDNLSLDNLALVRQAELAYLNRKHMIREDAELTKTGVLIARLAHAASSRKTKQTKKEKKHEADRQRHAVVHADGREDLPGADEDLRTVRVAQGRAADEADRAVDRGAGEDSAREERRADPAAAQARGGAADCWWRGYGMSDTVIDRRVVANTRCFDCTHAVPDGRHGCPWSRRGMPVPGWTAAERLISVPGQTPYETVKTYYVLACPRFLADHRDTLRHDVTGEGLELLARAIVRQAAEDYRTALRTERRHAPGEGRKRSTITELEHFFLSRWGDTLCYGMGQEVMERIRREDWRW